MGAGAIVCYSVGLALNTRQIRWAILIVAAATLLHGINNFQIKWLYSRGEMPTDGLDAILLSGWPSNLVVLAVAAGSVAWLARRRSGGREPPDLGVAA